MANFPTIAIGLPFVHAGGLDADAAAFLTAAGITDATITNAINRLVLNYKGQGNLNNSVDIWTGSKAIYPYVGGTLTTCKFNLKDPRDLDAAFRILFGGDMTASSNGITGGTTSMGNTYLKPSDLGRDSHRNLAYVRTDIGATAYSAICGATNAGFNNGISFETNKVAGNHASYSNTTFQILSNANRTGFIGLNRILSTTFKVFRNGTSLYSVTANSLAPISINMYVNAQNNNGATVSISKENLAYSVLGEGLSDANSLLEYQIVQQFQTDLSRNV
jgi:hypothetical protein